MPYANTEGDRFLIVKSDTECGRQTIPLGRQRSLKARLILITD